MNYYNEIKDNLINNEVTKKVKNYSQNRCDLKTYYSVGKLLMEAGKHYGEGIIKDYSRKLTIELGRGYSKRNLWLMLKFFELKEKMQTLSAQLTWSHYCELLIIKDIDEINYYIKISEQQNLSVRELRIKIKNKEYERLDAETKSKLLNKGNTEIKDFIKEPIIIKNSLNYNGISEKVLKKLILGNIPLFLEELGTGFSFIKDEYKIKVGTSYNYIDLLLYNIEFNCYVVVELKITELKKEHIGQIEVYMNYIDKTIKSINQNKTIGIIIVRKNNKFIMEYCSDKRILSKEYILI